METTKSSNGSVMGVWGWIRSHWIDILLPPTLLLLGAGVTRYVYWVRSGQKYDEAQRHYAAALSAEKSGDYNASGRELSLAGRAAPDDASIHIRLASAYNGMR